jgi:hypothetical protein
MLCMQKLISQNYVSQASETKWGANHPIPWKYLGPDVQFEEKWNSAMRCFNKSFGEPMWRCRYFVSDVYFSLDLWEEQEHLTTATKLLRKSAGLWAGYG